MLIKFFKNNEHADEFVNGSLHCTRIKEFKSMDKNNTNVLRGDRNEGSSKVINVKSGFLYIVNEENHTTKIPVVSSHITMTKGIDELKPIYCMFSLSPEFINRKGRISLDKKTIEIFDKRLKEFGEHCVIVTDTKEFLSRMQTVSDKYCVKIDAKYVEYTDTEDYWGDWDLFKKSNEYDFQSEYRFVFQNPIEDKFVKYDIGNLSDITMRIKTDQLESLFLKDDNFDTLFRLKWR